MARKVVKKKKIRIIPFLVLILMVVGIGFSVKFFLDKPILNIVIKGNDYLNDDYIISKAKIGDYPSFLLTSGSKVEKKLKKSPYIGDVNVKRKFNRSLIIDVNEKKPVVYDIYSKSIVFDDNSSLVAELIFTFIPLSPNNLKIFTATDITSASIAGSLLPSTSTPN